MTVGRELFDRLDQVGAEPWLPGLTLALVREAPLLDAGALCHQLRGAQQLFLVGITFIEDARRQAVRREDRDYLLGIREPRSNHPDVLGNCLYVSIQLMPALHEVEAEGRCGAASTRPRSQRLLHLATVSTRTDLRVMRRQHNGDQPIRPAVDDLVDRG